MTQQETMPFFVDARPGGQREKNAKRSKAVKCEACEAESVLVTLFLSTKSGRSVCASCIDLENR